MTFWPMGDPSAAPSYSELVAATPTPSDRQVANPSDIAVRVTRQPSRSALEFGIGREQISWRLYDFGRANAEFCESLPQPGDLIRSIFIWVCAHKKKAAHEGPASVSWLKFRRTTGAFVK
jgi:hypothetical protein